MEYLKARKPKIILFAIAFILLAGSVFYYLNFTAPERDSNPEQFNVPSSVKSSRELAGKLRSEGFIKSELGFRLIFSGPIDPGAYKLSKSISVFDIVRILKNQPYMKWVTIPEGLRKEEIADILSDALLWDSEKKNEWIEYTGTDPNYFEGVYFPETYLIPLDESPKDVVKRMQAKFEEKFLSYGKEAQRQNIKWTTLMKIASIVQREAASKDDMPIISGILWNRLLDNMKLEVDATVQYARGETAKGWWAPATADDIRNIDSPYNTYKYAGLPPHPISNPGIDAISAVLYPEKTDCLYYIHGKDKVIHCAKTYEEHRENIKKYL
ncbi:MAG: endolytic transglycosylase MltG [Candidatus Paceibacterota bacterium]|jgi:UPF0755 protein